MKFCLREAGEQASEPVNLFHLVDHIEKVPLGIHLDLALRVKQSTPRVVLMLADLYYEIRPPSKGPAHKKILPS